MSGFMLSSEQWTVCCNLHNLEQNQGSTQIIKYLLKLHGILAIKHHFQFRLFSLRGIFRLFYFEPFKKFLCNKNVKLAGDNILHYLLHIIQLIVYYLLSLIIVLRKYWVLSLLLTITIKIKTFSIITIVRLWEQFTKTYFNNWTLDQQICSTNLSK